jgi:hypothetical protein
LGASNVQVTVVAAVLAQKNPIHLLRLRLRLFISIIRAFVTVKQMSGIVALRYFVI